MILVCSNCSASYLLSASVFADGPRQVRCARCGNVWLADLPAKMTVMPSTEKSTKGSATETITAKESSKPITASPILAGSNLPALLRVRRWKNPRFWKFVAVCAFIAVLVTMGVVGRHAVAQKWPIIGWFYNTVGLKTHYEGEGLGLKNIHSERRYENGGMQLFVEGEIHNDSDETKKIPDIKVTAIGPDGKMTQNWKIDAPSLTGSPHEVIPFSSLLGTTQGAIVEVNLSFVEPKHESSE